MWSLILYVVCSMYVVFCKIDHCIHIHWCIVMGRGHNNPWVESHMWPHQTWGQRSSRGQWPLVQIFGKKGRCIHILWCIFKSNITVIAKVCDRESRRDLWFENHLVLPWYYNFMKSYFVWIVLKFLCCWKISCEIFNFHFLQISSCFLPLVMLWIKTICNCFVSFPFIILNKI